LFFERVLEALPNPLPDETPLNSPLMAGVGYFKPGTELLLPHSAFHDAVEHNV
jgi:hypothetical protein